MVMSNTLSVANHEWLLKFLIETALYHGTFELSSGKTSPYYVDCRRAMSHPEFRKVVGDALYYDICQYYLPDAIGGIALGGALIANAVSDAIMRNRGKSIPTFAIRPGRKSHGTQSVIEGDVKIGQNVVLVDDVVTTGGSLHYAIITCVENGLNVIKTLAIVDRQEDDLSSHRWYYRTADDEARELEALFTLDDLITMDEKHGV